MVTTYKGRKVLITGHTGFKGSWLAALLSRMGAEVSGYSLEPPTNPNHFSLLSLPIRSIINDINNRQELFKEIIEFSPEIIFHLAAQPLVRVSYENPFETYQTNVLGTLNVLEAGQKCENVKAIVVITTDKVYENKEWKKPYAESDQLGGYDIYSSSKACAEILVSSFRNSFLPLKDYNVKHTKLISTARAGNVIGGGDWSRDRLIPDMVKSASADQVTSIRNPGAIRPWQHVLDCLYGYLLLGEKLLNGDPAYAEPWNFAPYSDECQTVQDVVLKAQQTWPRIHINYQKPDKNYHEAGILMLDNKKSVEKLLWKPIWHTTESIEKTIEWYRSYYEDGIILTDQHITQFLDAWNS